MSAIRTLYTELKLRAGDAVKGLKAYDRTWQAVAKSVETSAGMIERSSNRAVLALQKMGEAAAVVRSTARGVGGSGGGGGAGGGSGGGGGSGRASGAAAERAAQRATETAKRNEAARAKQTAREEERAAADMERRARAQAKEAAARARPSRGKDPLDAIVKEGRAAGSREAKSNASQAGLAMGAKPIMAATAALGQFASAQDKAAAKVADLSAQVVRNQRDLAGMRAEAVRTGDAEGLLAAKMRALSAETGIASNKLQVARGELRALDGGFLGAVKSGLKLNGLFAGLGAAAGQFVAAGISRATGAVAGGLADAAKQAMGFEKALVDVAKVAKGGDLTKEGLLDPRIEKGIKDVSKELGVLPNEVAELTAAITASFSGQTDIVALAKDVTKIGVAWDISGGQAGEYFKQTAAGLQLNADETKQLFGTVNQLGNELGIKSAEIAEAMTRSAGVLKGANLSGETGAALNATLIKAGASAEVAATGVRTFVARLGAGKAATEKQVKAFDALGLSAESVAKNLSSGDTARAEGQIKEVVAALVKMGEVAPEDRMATLIELFGSESIGSIGAAATAVDTLATSFGIAGDKAAALTSVQSEYDRVSNTSAARVEKLKANIAVLAIELGDQLLPYIDKVVEFLTSKEGQDWGREAVKKSAEVIAGFVKVVGGLAQGLGWLIDKLGGTAVALGAVGLALRALTGPWGLMAAAAVAAMALIGDAISQTEHRTRELGKTITELDERRKKLKEDLAAPIEDDFEDYKAKQRVVDKRAALEKLKLDNTRSGSRSFSPESLKRDAARRAEVEKSIVEEEAIIAAEEKQIAARESSRIKKQQQEEAKRVAAEEIAAGKKRDESRFEELLRKRAKGKLAPSEATELRALSKATDKAIPDKPKKPRTHKETKMDKQLAAIDPTVRGVLTQGGDTDKGGDLKVADNVLDKAIFAKQNAANGAGGASGGLGSVGPGPNITNNYAYVTTNVGGINVDARGNGPAADNLAAAAGEVGEKVGAVRFTGAAGIVGQRLSGGARRGPV